MKTKFKYQDGKLLDKNGKEVGRLQKDGYLQFFVGGKGYLVHRIIYELVYGASPEFIDHIDGNRLNNHHENLRPATRNQNQHNRKINTNNKSGAKGVSLSRGKWQVRVQIDGKEKFFGRYDDIELADLVAQEARNKYHGQYARHK